MVLRVKLEIVPFGDEDKAYEIGRLDIYNKGPAYTKTGQYRQYGVINLTPEQIGHHVVEVTHNRKDGAWILLYHVLNELDIEGP